MTSTDTSSSSTRSSSPATSDAPSIPDDHAPFDSVDFSAWCHPFPEPDGVACDPETVSEILKPDKDLKSSELIAQTQEQLPEPPAVIEAPLAVNPAVFQKLLQPPPQAQTDMSAPLDLSFLSQFSSEHSSSDNAPVSGFIPRTMPSLTTATKVVPPPPMQPRKIESMVSHRVIYPVKESCYNLAILTPNIPSMGTKSRVETQVRVTLDLAFTSGTSSDPSHYDRIGSWKWLKLPKGTATRKRSRKEGKIDASPVDTLYLDAEVSCASNPTKQVTSCTTCQGREAKRVARKIAARVRPTRSDSESNDGDGSDSSSKIIQFNCPDTLDFSGGSVVLPLRITCYCRHHREKVGFNVHFAMKDVNGRIIGKGTSPPIMITDDHKSTDKSLQKYPQTPAYLGDMNWELHAPASNMNDTVPIDPASASGKRSSTLKDGTYNQSRRRAKPYDDTRSKSHRQRRAELQGNVDVTYNQPTPSISDSDSSLMTPFSAVSNQSSFDTLQTFPSLPAKESFSALPSPPNSSISPISPDSVFLDVNEFLLRDSSIIHPPQFFPLSPPETAPSSPPSSDYMPPPSAAAPLDLSGASFPYNILQSRHEQPLSLPAPRIQRLIPSSGPTYGGIEVTVLGSNFHASVRYDCVFGDTIATSTTRWSDNTLVCILPPRACPGVVSVALDNLKLDNGPEEPALFTYVNESDRSLMELALQVVGLKMTGKIEDVKDIAMRIVGNSSSDSPSSNGMGVPGMMEMTTSLRTAHRRLLSGRDGDTDFEKIIIDSLSVLDVRDSSGEPVSLKSIISHPTKTGQTLLHLAVSMNFPSLVESLIERDIDLDAQDNNGYTALHFAAVFKSDCCARQLINAGAKRCLRTHNGQTASDLAPEGFFRENRTVATSSPEVSDDESHFGDNEEDSENESRSQVRGHQRRRARRPRSRRSSVPASVASDGCDAEPLNELDDDNATIVSPDGPSMDGLPGKGSAIDEKQAASFAEYLGRAWAQFQPPQLVPQMPGMPAWVFPVYIPMQGWPALRGDKHGKDSGEMKGSNVEWPTFTGSEWRTAWERWTAQTGVTQDQLASKAGSAVGMDTVPETAPAPIPTPSRSRSIFRRTARAQQPPPVSEKEVNAYSYRPMGKSLAKRVKKEDRMLFFFWIPIIIVAIIWALFKSHPIIAFLKQEFPLEDISERIH